MTREDFFTFNRGWNGKLEAYQFKQPKSLEVFLKMPDGLITVQGKDYTVKGDSVNLFKH